MADKTVRNIHGRRGGRGARPYLLVAKLLGVSAFLGGLISVLVLVLMPDSGGDAEVWRMRAGQVRRAFEFVIVPGLLLAMLSGLVLLASVWRALIRMRWFVVKVVLVVACVPTLHVYMHGRSLALAKSLGQDPPNLVAAGEIRSQMIAGAVAALVFGGVVLVLGRIKPRLGQQYGRTFAKRGSDEGAPLEFSE
jgi:hypothetical protein